MHTTLRQKGERKKNAGYSQEYEDHHFLNLPALAEQVREVMLEEGRTMSELVREALRNYMEEREWVREMRYERLKKQEGRSQKEEKGMKNQREKEITPVALYARVSSDRQDIDLSVSAQLRALRDHARRTATRW